MAKKIDRDTELSKKAKIEEKLHKLYSTVEDGFKDQSNRADDTCDSWDAYNCLLGDQQFYSGTSKIFVPIIKNAVRARRTRFVNQLFPKSDRYVDCVTSNGEVPHEEIALIENYVRRTKLRTEVTPALCVNGDVEGQYNLYVDWSTAVRHVTWKEEKPIKSGGIEYPMDKRGDGIEEMEHDIVLEDRPTVEVLSDSDVCILPVTVNNIEEAIDQGGSVTIIRRWTKGQIKQMIDDDEIREDTGEYLTGEMDKALKAENYWNAGKHHADAAGIKEKGRVALVYETWSKIKVEGELRLCRSYFGGDKMILSCKLNKFWNDRCPLISKPVEKVSGVVKGQSLVAPCLTLQYSANDAVNEGMDSAAYALCPIIATDPTKNPRVNTMILDIAAVWEVDPNSTKFMNIPPVWEKAFEIVTSAKQEIFQTLSVNPSMMPQGTGGKSKRNQAEIANEQQVDLLTTSDSVTTLEDVLSEVVQRFAEYDAQFRTQDSLIKVYGHAGLRASIQRVPPLRMGSDYMFIWSGVEQARNAAMIQQQIAFVNVLKGLPPQMMPGRRIDVVPLIENAVGSVFGHRLAPKIFVDESTAYMYDPEWENEHVLDDGHEMPVSAQDDDKHHIEVHGMAFKALDPMLHTRKTDVYRKHLFDHMMQLQKKSQATQAQPPGLSGAPGGAGKGTAGAPKPGAQPGQQRLKGPPGMIHNDRMASSGAVTMPRKM